MTKFLFNLQTLTLQIFHGEHSITILRQFHTLGGIGFALDHHEPPERWIIFKVYGERVRVVHKEVSFYYYRELTRPPSGIIEFWFSEWDRVNK
jgi:hypothetical protein